MKLKYELVLSILITSTITQSSDINNLPVNIQTEIIQYCEQQSLKDYCYEQQKQSVINLSKDHDKYANRLGMGRCLNYIKDKQGRIYGFSDGYAGAHSCYLDYVSYNMELPEQLLKKDAFDALFLSHKSYYLTLHEQLITKHIHLSDKDRIYNLKAHWIDQNKGITNISLIYNVELSLSIEYDIVNGKIISFKNTKLTKKQIETIKKEIKRKNEEMKKLFSFE